MNDEKEKPPIVTPQQQESASGLSRASAALGGASFLLMAGSITLRLIFGSNRIGLTGYGERLYQFGFPFPLATALDFGNASELMILAMLLGFIAFILGVIAVFCKGRKRLAKIGILTGGLVVFVPLLLPIL
jgi:vacuolar-type H+-ATPase subunit I/STV1